MLGTDDNTFENSDRVIDGLGNDLPQWALLLQSPAVMKWETDYRKTPKRGRLKVAR